MTTAAATPPEDCSQDLGSDCTYGSGNSSCIDDGRTGSSSHQSQPSLECLKNARNGIVGSNGAADTKLTSQSLAQHEREQAYLHTATPTGVKPKQKQSSGVMAAAQSLDIDLSKKVFDETMQDLEGKEPMERYLTEKSHGVHAKASPGGIVGVYRTD